jgi:hypothetical protein
MTAWGQVLRGKPGDAAAVTAEPDPVVHSLHAEALAHRRGVECDIGLYDDLRIWEHELVAADAAEPDSAPGSFSRTRKLDYP